MFTIDPQSRQPVYEQIVSQAEEFILRGILSAGAQMPSVRGLSISLCANPNTIQKAYSELDSRGLIFSVPGKGCFVSENAREKVCRARQGRLGELKKLLEELRLAETAKEDIMNILNQVYGGVKNDKN
ncbi:MAG: GntR family transcriptional regulator [Clostridia bacterium]|nr:GntR family transcriptional regulator [Clostridia bacterium]